MLHYTIVQHTHAVLILILNLLCSDWFSLIVYCGNDVYRVWVCMCVCVNNKTHSELREKALFIKDICQRAKVPLSHARLAHTSHMHARLAALL